MYLTHFRLQRQPFSMTPDPAFLYLTNGHREALAALTYAILGRKGFVVLTGEAGTGKTTLIAKVIQSISSTRVLSSVVLNPTLTPAEFLETILLTLGITDVPQSKAQRLQFLHGVLLEADKNGKVPVLIVDEAHKVPPDVLEEIRLLSNFEKPESKLIQIVLAGQSELRDLLNREDLRQFKQRISMRVEIHALTEPELNNYLQHRWMKAGSVSPHPFSADAMARIARYSQGIPRVVNALVRQRFDAGILSKFTKCRYRGDRSGCLRTRVAYCKKQDSGSTAWRAGGNSIGSCSQRSHFGNELT